MVRDPAWRRRRVELVSTSPLGFLQTIMFTKTWRLGLERRDMRGNHFHSFDFMGYILVAQRARESEKQKKSTQRCQLCLKVDFWGDYRGISSGLVLSCGAYYLSPRVLLLRW